MSRLRPPCCILHKLLHHPVESIEQKNPPWVRGEELKHEGPPYNSDTLALILQDDEGADMEKVCLLPQHDLKIFNNFRRISNK